MHPRYINFKHEEDEKMFLSLAPLLVHVAADMANYCKENNLPFVITDTISTMKQDLKIKRVSSSHRTGRAIDVSVMNWNQNQVSKFVDKFNLKYANIAAVSKSTLKPTLVVYHNHINWHLHIQIHPRYSVIDNN